MLIWGDSCWKAGAHVSLGGPRQRGTWCDACQVLGTCGKAVWTNHCKPIITVVCFAGCSLRKVYILFEITGVAKKKDIKSTMEAVERLDGCGSRGVTSGTLLLSGSDQSWVRVYDANTESHNYLTGHLKLCPWHCQCILTEHTDSHISPNEFLKLLF